MSQHCDECEWPARWRVESRTRSGDAIVIEVTHVCDRCVPPELASFVASMPTRRIIDLLTGEPVLTQEAQDRGR